MSTSPPINYARVEGIYKSELAAPIIFAIAYTPLFFFNVFRSIRHPTYVLIMLSIFCLIRITAFVMRAILAGSDTAGTNVNVVVAEAIIYGVGFFGLLYSAYTLVLDRQSMIPHSGLPGILGIIDRIMLRQHFVRIVLLVAVVLGIIGGEKASESSPSAQSDGQTFRRASIYIFLVIAILLVILTARLAYDEHRLGMRNNGLIEPVGRQYRLFVLLAIAILCLGREAFLAATSGNTRQQNNPRLFYPLPALFELLTVILFAAPGLVPSRRELNDRKETLMNDSVEMGQNGR